MRKPLGNGRRNPHTDERAGSVAQHDCIEIDRCYVTFLQDIVDHRHEQARMLAGLLLVTANHPVLQLQCHRTGQRRGIECQQPHATAPDRS